MSAHPGQELKKFRESKGISLEQAAKDTCLRTDVLRQLEESEDVDAMPEVYRKLSLRMYARYLGVAVNQNRTPRQGDGVELSPVDGCVELAYSETMRDEAEPKKRRTVGPGTILAVTALLILTTGLWSLNAKISRLNFDEKQERAAARAAAEPVNLAAPAEATDPIRLEDSVFLTLSPVEPAADAPAAP
jgi:cytoskeletal protein RodZ